MSQGLNRRHMSAAILGEAGLMRRFLLAAVLLSAAPLAAHADPQSEARSAVGACISAIADGAPVPDQIKGEAVEIRREKEPETCTVTVTGGEPAAIRAGVLDALARKMGRL